MVTLFLPSSPHHHHHLLTPPELIKKYTQDHEWITLDTSDSSRTATIGITTYAASSLGDVVYVELPSCSTTVEAGEAFGAVESVKSASDILSPVAGEVVEVNTKLNDKPALINKAPEGEGWIVKVKVEGVQVMEGEGLMGEEEYLEMIESS
ncbi:glycine cleavage H-protein [Wilcoxina mikolae CBS 423.85]|nr:glycine cleavage H-protein [Wilcoxina mikolae CBS 423.85]